MTNEQAPNGLRAAREAKGLSQTELGLSVGVTKQAISQYETGVALPSIGVGLALSRALNASLEALFWPAESNAELERRGGPAATTRPSKAIAAPHAAKVATRKRGAGKGISA